MEAIKTIKVDLLKKKHKTPGLKPEPTGRSSLVRTAHYVCMLSQSIETYTLASVASVSQRLTK